MSFLSTNEFRPSDEAWPCPRCNCYECECWKYCTSAVSILRWVNSQLNKRPPGVDSGDRGVDH